MAGGGGGGGGGTYSTVQSLFPASCIHSNICHIIDVSFKAPFMLKHAYCDLMIFCTLSFIDNLLLWPNNKYLMCGQHVFLSISLFCLDRVAHYPSEKFELLNLKNKKHNA